MSRSGARKFSSASSNSQADLSKAAGVAAGGLMILLFFGRGGKKASAVSTADENIEEVIETAPVKSLSDRVAALENEISQMVALKKNR